MSNKLTVVQAFHERADIVQAVQAFHEIVNRVIAKAINSGNHSDDRVLLILTETDLDSGYGYDENDISYPHSADGRLIMSFGKNEKGQRQFLVSFDPTGCDDKTYPDPSVPPGWDWQVYETQQPKPESKPEQEVEQPQLVILLTRPKQAELSPLADTGKAEISGFSLVKMPDLENFEQFAIIIDQSVFSVQVRTT